MAEAFEIYSDLNKTAEEALKDGLKSKGGLLDLQVKARVDKIQEKLTVSTELETKAIEQIGKNLTKMINDPKLIEFQERILHEIQQDPVELNLTAPFFRNLCVILLAVSWLATSTYVVATAIFVASQLKFPGL